MNERIKLLAGQAGFDMEEGGHIMLHHVYLTNRMEKFAELIVRECMDVAKDHTPNTEECEYTWLIHDKIKQHFGVEE